jgi:hypothetical protein
MCEKFADARERSSLLSICSTALRSSGIVPEFLSIFRTSFGRDGATFNCKLARGTGSLESNASRLCGVGEELVVIWYTCFSISTQPDTESFVEDINFNTTTKPGVEIYRNNFRICEY